MYKVAIVGATTAHAVRVSMMAETRVPQDSQVKAPKDVKQQCHAAKSATSGLKRQTSKDGEQEKTPKAPEVQIEELVAEPEQLAENIRSTKAKAATAVPQDVVDDNIFGGLEIVDDNINNLCDTVDVKIESSPRTKTFFSAAGNGLSSVVGAIPVPNSIRNGYNSASSGVKSAYQSAKKKYDDGFLHAVGMVDRKKLYKKYHDRQINKETNVLMEPGEHMQAWELIALLEHPAAEFKNYTNFTETGDEMEKMLQKQYKLNPIRLTAKQYQFVMTRQVGVRDIEILKKEHAKRAIVSFEELKKLHDAGVLLTKTERKVLGQTEIIVGSRVELKDLTSEKYSYLNDEFGIVTRRIGNGDNVKWVVKFETAVDETSEPIEPHVYDPKNLKLARYDPLSSEQKHALAAHNFLKGGLKGAAAFPWDMYQLGRGNFKFGDDSELFNTSTKLAGEMLPDENGFMVRTASNVDPSQPSASI